MIALCAQLPDGSRTWVLPPNPIPPGRSWILGIIGLRVEAGASFLRAHRTTGTPTRIELSPPTSVLIGWTRLDANGDPLPLPLAPVHSPAPAPTPAPAPRHATARLTLALHDPSTGALIATTTSTSATEHAYANIFAKWEPTPAFTAATRLPRLIECGYELTTFSTPRAGHKHPRAALATFTPDDPACPVALHVTLTTSWSSESPSNPAGPTSTGGWISRAARGIAKP